MKILALFGVFAVICSGATAMNLGALRSYVMSLQQLMTPANLQNPMMRKMIMDMITFIMKEMHSTKSQPATPHWNSAKPASNFPPPKPHTPPQHQPYVPPRQPYVPHQQPHYPHHQPAYSGGPLSMPGGAHGAHHFVGEYCPPGPARMMNDHCKEVALQKALYDMTKNPPMPKYPWVPHFNYMDPISDNLKGQVERVLMYKAQTKGGRLTPQEYEIFSMVGDAKHMAMFNPAG